MATDTWNTAYEADPSDTDLANLYANRMRNLKLNIRERMELDHEWEDAATGGKHKKVTLLQQGAAPSPGTDEFNIYTKDDGGDAELFYKDENGNEYQVTKDGQIILDDHSDDAATQALVRDPGITGAEVLPADGEQEIETLRYVARRQAHGAAGRNTSDLAKWIDLPVRGLELTKNPAFLDDSASGAAPDGYALEGTPSAIAPEALDVTEGVGKQLSITADAANEGISQTYSGIKANAYYLVEVRVKPAVGTWTLKTTGATGSVFGNLAQASSGTGWQTLKGIILTDGTPTNIGVQLHSGASLDTVKVAFWTFRECRVDFGDRLPNEYVIRKTSTYSGSIFTETISTDLDAKVIVPGPGYVIEVEANAAFEEDSGSLEVILEEEIDGGGFSPVSRDARRETGTAQQVYKYYMRYIRAATTPGSVYRYRVSVGTNVGSPNYTTAVAAYNVGPHQLTVKLRKI